MTLEDVIRLMTEACDPDKVPAFQNDFWTITQEELERFASLVAANERESCAKVCDDQAMKGHTYDMTDSAEKCAEAIRARGQQ